MELLTTSAAARVLGVSVAWVRMLALRGELPHQVTTSGQRLFRGDTVAALAANRRARPGPSSSSPTTAPTGPVDPVS